MPKMTTKWLDKTKAFQLADYIQNKGLVSMQDIFRFVGAKTKDTGAIVPILRYMDELGILVYQADEEGTFTKYGILTNELLDKIEQEKREKFLQCLMM